jgi:hypothetical protein
MTQNEKTPGSGIQTYACSCHCGAVRFLATLDLASGGGRCNCSVCTKIAQLGATMKPDALQVISGEESLSTYVWGQKVSTRYFCKHCGVHCFGRGDIPEIGGAYASVNLNCLDEVDVSTLGVSYWDGRHDNWMGGKRSTPWPSHPVEA